MWAGDDGTPRWLASFPSVCAARETLATRGWRSPLRARLSTTTDTLTHAVQPAAKTVSSLFPTLIKQHNKANPQTPPPRARPHDLRHLHATTLLLAGVPVHVVAGRLGHADPSITLRVFAHVVRSGEASQPPQQMPSPKPSKSRKTRVSRGVSKIRRLS
ncbi:tyrosine-type recombinase/integrase [Nonomuraea longicatena]|uniref:tyrosine-type recombinase/integrase n=1 Tax=Nonomuraea longicatena TaxID=83682 RepID=UPI003CD055E6